MHSSLQAEDDILSRVMKETQERIRLFEESQRRWQDQQQPTHMQSPPPLTQVSYIIIRYYIQGFSSGGRGTSPLVTAPQHTHTRWLFVR